MLFTIGAAIGATFLGGDALASTASSPFGSSTPVVAIIGSYNGQQIVQWQNQYTGACAQTVIGNASGLTDNWLIASGSGSDTIYRKGWHPTFCGKDIGELVYNGHYLDIDAGGGNDWVTLQTGDTWIYGGAGNDYMDSTDPYAHMYGQAGNDFVRSVSAFTDFDVLSGGDGDDCLEDMSWSAVSFDCGPGANDRRHQSNAPANAVGCELTTTAPCIPF
jgi:Ca2+-binding RTX toxin-like protein